MCCLFKQKTDEELLFGLVVSEKCIRERNCDRDTQLTEMNVAGVLVFFFKQKTAYEFMTSLVGSERCIRDS